MIRVKVCGITSFEDAICAVKNGVSALGFNFYKRSPRYISPVDAKNIIAELPPFITSVGLFVNERIDDVLRVAGLTGIHTLQFHGDESQEYCDSFSGYYVIKAIRAKNEMDLQVLDVFSAQSILIDSYNPNFYGGTGVPFSWELLRKVPERYKGKMIVAGGINSDNISELLNVYMPYAIDVCSGIESSPGIKDHSLLNKLMNKVATFK
ncbi:MAG: phosphoribosylanthranilate isomerase [Candidatus Auribacter fodinae]|jgi:phosphoribosylanthranilate isomerase|uniref:N-(5'-phosphoribosyl)anthranilate isomerase n=1 Tax=Candidatus Auribacter fodinae TaxID=2093366 RepID=A0A3A4R6X9_9BACT|nr:MAG: phosphoribosylanthranilate isomerase [Candidatus Auribacter fodinae]